MRTALALLLLLTCSCAADRSAGERLSLAQRDVLDAMQFGDFHVLSRYVRPERRPDFLSRAYGVEKSLHVLEIAPLDAAILGDRARTTARVSWYELPSTVVRTDTVFFEWVRVDPGWAIDAISGGPLPLEATPEPAPPAEPAPAG